MTLAMADFLDENFVESVTAGHQSAQKDKMAKSLRSKFKRKMRSIARAKKAPKERILLDAAVARREAYELEQAAKEDEAAKNAPGTDKLETMDDTGEGTAKKATINLKTMKRADGTYPPWLSGS
ncbi:unnamed protein product [Haemonchus placei]|uniref:DUF1713 domain-containing protein n=1 Tax=Haemonchus placei TaxID=6290 RepID=A0A0N4X6D6_HAEPC|nr:unnamed protein product [Haemonchus placei]